MEFWYPLQNHLKYPGKPQKQLWYLSYQQAAQQMFPSNLGVYDP